MRLFIFAATILAVAPLAGEDTPRPFKTPQANAAKTAFDRQVSEAAKGYAEAVQKARRDYVASLKAALNQAMDRKDLEDANAIQAAIKTVDGELAGRGAAPTDINPPVVPGLRALVYKGNGVKWGAGAVHPKDTGGEAHKANTLDLGGIADESTMILDGILTVPAGGAYIFIAVADSMVDMYLGNTKVLSCSKRLFGDTTKPTERYVPPGTYPIRAEYSNLLPRHTGPRAGKLPDSAMSIRWRTKDGEGPIPIDALRRP